MQQRTQIYLKPAQHAALLKESRHRGLSLAAVIRALVDEHLHGKKKSVPTVREREKAALSLIGLGASGFTDVSENVDEHLARAVHEELLREPGPRYRGSGKARKRAGR